MRRVRHAESSKISNNTIEEFANTGISVQWNACNAYIAGNTIRSSESNEGCGIALSFKPAAAKNGFTIKNNHVEVRHRTCVSTYYADGILIEGNNLFGRIGIDCASGIRNMKCTDNYIN